MSDEFTGNVAPNPVAGQPSGDPIQSGGAGSDAPAYVTAKDLAAFEDRLERRLQSLNDKQENRLKKEFEQKLSERQNAYAAMGIQMPEAEKAEIARSVINSAAKDGSQPAQAADPSADPLVVSVNTKAAAILNGAGVDWMRDFSEEERGTLTAIPDPLDFLAAIKDAVAQRKGQQRPLSPASAPVLGGGTPAGGDRITELTNRLQELQKNPGRNGAEIRKLSRELEPLLRSSRR